MPIRQVDTCNVLVNLSTDMWGVINLKVSNQPVVSQQQAVDPALELKQGEVHRATIKERTGNQEAILQIRGKDVPVTFQGSVPRHDRVIVQVTSHQEGRVEVRSLGQAPQNQSTPTADTHQILRNLGVSNQANPALREAVRLFLDRGLPVSREIVQEIRLFLEQGRGTLAQKLDTIQTLLNKGLPVQSSLLHAVQETLHGQPLAQVLAHLTRDLSHQSVGARSEQGGMSPSFVRQLAKEVLRQFQEIDSRREPIAQPVTQREGTSSLWREAIQYLQREADLSRALSQLSSQLLNHSSLGQDVTRQLEQAWQKAVEWQQQGRELAARGHLVQVLTSLAEQEASHSPSAASGVTAESTQQVYAQNELLHTNPALQTQAFLVTKVTEKLSAASKAFTDLKREVTRSLDQLIRLAQQWRQQAIPQARQLLQTAIDKLDKAILKSELTMLTDMKTEKQLMQASSQLAQARRSLAKGNVQAAQRMVQEVKAMLERLRWQPSETRVQHMLLKESQVLEQQRPLPQLVQQQLAEQTRLPLHAEPSARHMLELIRGLGLHHESELGRSLMGQQEQQDAGGRQANLKAMLLQLMRSEWEQGRIQQQAEQALNNLIGQQLLNKQEPNSAVQHLFFQLPVKLEEELHNLKVMVNARQEGEKLDWENCSLYFLIETKKLGEVGILLSAVERNLSVTLKNNKPDFKEKMLPLVEECKENLKAIGYQITSIQFSKLDTKEQGAMSEENRLGESQHEPRSLSPSTVTAKGFDLKI